MTYLINHSMLERLISRQEANEIVDKIYKEIAEGGIHNPSKVYLDLGEGGANLPYEGFMNAMPAYIQSMDMAGMKWVGGFEGERKKKGLPYIIGLILLLDPHLGEFKAVVDGQWITNWRTGAQAAVAISYVKEKPSLDLAVFGTGRVIRDCLAAISEKFTITSLKVWNHRPESAVKLKEDMAPLIDGEITIYEDPKEACQAEVIISATHSPTPVIKGDWVEPGTMVLAMSSGQDVDNDLIFKADKIICDHIDQTLNRGALDQLHKEGKITEEDIFATFTQLGTKEKIISPEEQAQDIILCLPIGMGAVDVGFAAYAYHKADKENLPSFDFLA